MIAARNVRVVLMVLALPVLLAGCSGGSLNSFDPTDLLDFLDTKKKLPGDRRPVFPEGVPGVEPGVPQQMMKGNQPPPDAAPAEPPPPAAEPAPAPKRAAPKRTAAKPAARAKPQPAPQAEPPQDDGPDDAAPPPPQQPQRQQPQGQPQGQSGSSAFPAPLPSGTFQR